MKFLYFSFNSLIIFFCWQNIFCSGFLHYLQKVKRTNYIHKSQPLYESFDNNDNSKYENKTAKFMIFNNKESRRLTADEIAKGRPREAYRNITYNSIDDIEPEDLFEKFLKSFKKVIKSCKLKLDAIHF